MSRPRPEIWDTFCDLHYVGHKSYAEIAAMYDVDYDFVRRACKSDPRYDKNKHIRAQKPITADSKSKYSKTFDVQFRAFEKYCASDENVKGYKPTFDDYIRYMREPSGKKDEDYYLDGYGRLCMAIVYQAVKDACKEIIEDKKEPEDCEAYMFLLSPIAEEMSNGLSLGVARKVKENPESVLGIIYSENNLINRRYK